MFLTLYFDTHNYDFNLSQHSIRAAAEAAFEGLLREFVVPKGAPTPPKKSWPDLFDEGAGEAPQIFEIVADGGPPQNIKPQFCGAASAA